jgi:hypothetical protein
VKKLLEIGGYLNKGYHVFVDNYFMSVPVVCHLHQLSTYITGGKGDYYPRGKGDYYPRSSGTNLQLDKKCMADLVPFLHTFSSKRNHKKILSFFSPAMPQPKKRKYREDMVAIHK